MKYKLLTGAWAVSPNALTKPILLRKADFVTEKLTWCGVPASGASEFDGLEGAVCGELGDGVGGDTGFQLPRVRVVLCWRV